MTIHRLFDLTEKKALIIGESPSGRGTETLLGEAGAEVELLDPGADETAIVDAVTGFTARHGRVDIMVYAALAVATYSLPDTTVEQWDRINDLNLRGAFIAMRETIKVMRGHGGGVITAISTIGSLHPVLEGNGAYGASKAGLGGLVRSAAYDHAKDNIRINAVLAGGIPVPPRLEDAIDVTGPAFQPGRMMLGLGTPEEIAAGVLFLVSPAGRLVTGQALPLDGGFLIS